MANHPNRSRHALIAELVDVLDALSAECKRIPYVIGNTTLDIKALVAEADKVVAKGRAAIAAPARPVLRLTFSDREFLTRCKTSNVMVIQAADRFKRLERRGLVRADYRNIGLRQPVLVIALTDAGEVALAAVPLTPTTEAEKA